MNTCLCVVWVRRLHVWVCVLRVCELECVYACGVCCACAWRSAHMFKDNCVCNFMCLRAYMYLRTYSWTDTSTSRYVEMHSQKSLPLRYIFPPVRLNFSCFSSQLSFCHITARLIPVLLPYLAFSSSHLFFYHSLFSLSFSIATIRNQKS